MTRAAPSATVLGTRQLNRALLERQGLLRRTPTTPEELTHRLVGLQAQEPPDPYVAMWSRIEGFDPESLSAAIESRRLVRVVGYLRGTIHLVTADDCLVLRPLTQPVGERQWASSSFAKSLGDVDVAEVVAAGRALLAEGPMPSGEIGRRLLERWPGRDAPSLGYAVRFHLPLIQVPPRGLWGRSGSAVLAGAESWLGRPMSVDGSPDELVQRYLAAFGPATVGDARAWSSVPGLRAAFERLRPGLRTFRDEAGRELFDVPDGPLPDPDTPAPVRFLPTYDNLMLGHEDRSRVIPPAHGAPEWLRGSFLVDGFLAGTWRADASGGELLMRVGARRPLSDADLAEVEAEGRRLLDFLARGGPGTLTFVNLEAMA